MKARYFFAISLVVLGVGAWQLYDHQKQMDILVGSIQNKDISGQPIDADIANAQTYASQHMATSSSVFLSGSYDRAMATSTAASNPASNGAVYAQAQASCAGKADSIVQAKCVSAYVAAHAAPSANPQAVATPTKEAYTKPITAPAWTPDSVGITLLAGLVAAAMGLYLVIIRRF
jgi:hypothetical protein